jgi:hypothetical protein
VRHIDINEEEVEEEDNEEEVEQVGDDADSEDVEQEQVSSYNILQQLLDLPIKLQASDLED